jgi:pimeloyl-ACP methyl ester carboxylesterase
MPTDASTCPSRERTYCEAAEDIASTIEEKGTPITVGVPFLRSLGIRLWDVLGHSWSGSAWCVQPRGPRRVVRRPGHGGIVRSTARRECDGRRNRGAPAPGRLRLHDELRALSVPTLVIHGERDALPAAVALELSELLPRARHALLPDAGHTPFWEAPERFFDAAGSSLAAPSTGPPRTTP